MTFWFVIPFSLVRGTTFIGQKQYGTRLDGVASQNATRWLIICLFIDIYSTLWIVNFGWFMNNDLERKLKGKIVYLKLVLSQHLPKWTE
jgi:hypothetical protein